MTAVARWNKTATPPGTDGWNLTTDLGKALDSANVIVPVATQAERDALTPPLGKYAGMTVVRMDVAGNPLEVWDGSVGNRYSPTYAKAAGRGVLNSIPAVNPNLGPVWVPFPTGRFTLAPIVTITSDQSRVIVVAADVSTTGFNLYATNVTTSNSGAGEFRWSAEQMTSTMADG